MIASDELRARKQAYSRQFSVTASQLAALAISGDGRIVTGSTAEGYRHATGVETDQRR